MNVLSSVSDGPHEFVVINKHDPAGVYPAWHPVYWTRFLPKGRIRAAEALSTLFSRFGGSRVDRCDLIIQCGTPVYWRGCHHAEWAKVIWRDVLDRLSEKIKIVNLAAGSCYAWENRPDEIEDVRDAEYIRSIHRCCRVTTVRDPLAHRLLNRLGLDTRLIPCSALLAGRNYRQTETADRVFVNYMKIGGHFEYNQSIDPARWHNVLKDALNELSARHRITLICHNQNEYQLAQTAFPEYEAVLPRSVEEYFETARTGIAGIFNRLHASVAFAGLIPILSQDVGVDLYNAGIRLPDCSIQTVGNVVGDATTWNPKLLRTEERRVVKTVYEKYNSDAFGSDWETIINEVDMRSCS